jgi:hypothetical protein
MVTAIRKVVKYLVTTKSEGIGYSPDAERAFEQTYSKLLPEGREVPLVNIFSDASYANCLATLRSTSGSVGYYRSCPIFWKSNKQTVRAYSTAESEFIACSDAICLSEQHDFFDFFRPLPSHAVESRHGIAPSLEDTIVWCDNTSAISTAKSVACGDTKPKSRHYALRYLRVKDAASSICYCPTTLQKADGLTKVECSVKQRRLLLHHIYDPVYDDEQDSYDEYEDDEQVSYVCLGDLIVSYIL